MRTIIIVGVVFAASAVISSIVFAPFLARLARRWGIDSRWAWYPVVNLTLIPRLAYASRWSVFLLAVPLVNIYVWWDWWEEIAFELRKERVSLWALGMSIPLLNIAVIAKLAGDEKAGARESDSASAIMTAPGRGGTANG
jgi:hypothetical protein